MTSTQLDSFIQKLCGSVIVMNTSTHKMQPALSLNATVGVSSGAVESSRR